MSFEDLVERWDQLSPKEACARAWLDPGPQHGTWHRQAKAEIGYLMPMLARALDRLVIDVDVYPVDPQLWADLPRPVIPTARSRSPRGSAT